MLLLGNKNVKPKNLIIKDNENTICYNDMYIESENKCINRNNITKQIFNQYSNLFFMLDLDRVKLGLAICITKLKSIIRYLY